MVWYGMIWYDILHSASREFCKGMDGLDGGNIR